MHPTSHDAPRRGNAFATSFVVLVAGVSIGATLIATAYQFSLFALAIAGGAVLLATSGLALWLTGRENRQRFTALLNPNASTTPRPVRAQPIEGPASDRVRSPAARPPKAAPTPPPAPPRRPTLGEVRAQARTSGVWPPGGKPYPDTFEDPPAEDALVEFQPVARSQGASTLRFAAEDGAASPPARDRLAWPGTKEADAWRTFTGGAPRRYERIDHTSEAKRRRDRLASSLPTSGSILQNVPRPTQGAAPAGKTRGKCSSCGTRLYAPKKRPITVVCPRCQHKARLTR